MANLRDIRRRIRSVKSTQQITKAMKMVAAAKLRRAQERMFAARPYADKIQKVLGSLAGRAEESLHPLLAVREEKKVVAGIITADRGLCGAFNTNILRRSTQFIKEHPGSEYDLSLAPIGRKARDFYRRRNHTVARDWSGIFRQIGVEHAEEIAGFFMETFSSGEADSVYLVYNEFKSVIRQEVVVQRLLPIEREELEEAAGQIDYIYEPNDKTIFEALLPRYVTFQVYRALLESYAAEQAGRMTAMENATNNAKDMIDALTLHANRVRQAGITKELIEIVSGAEALE